MVEEQVLAGARRWVVKIGSSLLTAEGRGLDEKAIADWARQIAALHEQGRQVVVVSSGAVAEGLARLQWAQRPLELHRLQAAAAVGQMGLVQAWESALKSYGLKTAQVLITHEEVASRKRYLNARATLLALLELGVVPVVNENDSVATDEIRFGDNDTLAALTVNLIDADLLVILTDQAGLYEADPKAQADAKLVEVGAAGDEGLRQMAGEGSAVGRGGMRTKLTAAEWAARSGASTLISHGRSKDGLLRTAAGERVGTLLLAGEQKMTARKRWLAGMIKAEGRLVVDAGAARVLRESGRSLLPVGVVEVVGEFGRGDLVLCVDEAGVEVGRGLVNYSAQETRRLAGRPTQDMAEILGYVGDSELIHRDNLVVL